MITQAVLDKILGCLAPLFLDAVKGDAAAARSAANAKLASYEARTNRQLRLAALAIAFSFGALDSLSRAADHDLPLNQVLRLRGNANALNRAANQNETRLEKQQRQGDTAAPEATAGMDLPTSGATGELVACVRSAWKAEKAAAAAQPAAPLSRQQRRFAERKLEKQLQRQQEQARLAERAAIRDAARAEARSAA
jgi:hypothetical protein